ncbi:MAG: SMI1/KNR4 family protein [Cytophagaceae bacterium]|nr:SMI1/KNR4 family protein [Cytophagaceae bacterium]
MKPTAIQLPPPQDTPAFFQAIKEKSNQYWRKAEIDKSLFGFQIQEGTKWRDGLTDDQLRKFETEMGLKFPESLRNFYLTMNGLDKPGINVYGASGEPYAYWPIYYSFPEDIEVIKEQILWIYSSNNTNPDKLKEMGASRIFPICGHRFLLLDEPDNPILSMYAHDIIYWTDSLSKLIATHIFPVIENESDFDSDQTHAAKIKFWLNK